MDDKTPATPVFREASNDELPGYRRFNVLAPVALVAGLASVSAMFSPMLWSVAGFGLLIGVFGVMSVLRQGQQSDPARLATIGLALSLLFVTAAPTRYLLHQYHVGQQAAEVGAEWLSFTLSRQPFKAFEARMPVLNRHPLDPDLLKLYAEDSSKTDLYRDFLNSPLIKALTLLPPGARVRLYKTESIEPNLNGEGDFIWNVFAVTYYEQGQKKSFFVRIQLWRGDDAASVRGFWQVLHYEGGVRPRNPPSD